jgi:hypothetical protein
MAALISATKTAKGLTVTGVLDTPIYEIGKKISDEAFNTITIQKTHSTIVAINHLEKEKLNVQSSRLDSNNDDFMQRIPVVSLYPRILYDRKTGCNGHYGLL